MRVGLLVGGGVLCWGGGCGGVGVGCVFGWVAARRQISCVNPTETGSIVSLEFCCDAV